MTALAGTDLEYPIRQWVFEDAAGRFDIDLGDSNVQCARSGPLTAAVDVELDYGLDRGTTRLRRLIAEQYRGSVDSVAVTHGSQEALFLLYSTLLRPGDQVITFRPGWQQSWVVPAMLSAEVTVLDLADDFTIDVDAVRAAAGPDLRLVVVNTPCNPTGRVAGERELDALLELVGSTGGYLLLDEEYGLDLASSPAVRSDRALSVSGLSKVYGLPGLRIGWLYGPPDVVTACVERKHFTSISNSVLCEALACDVLTDRDRYAAEYRRLTQAGLELLGEWAARHPGEVSLVPPEGTPFAWLHLTTGEPSLSFCRRVLDAGVLLMPAETLGGRDGVRLCFAREQRDLAEGLRRIDAVLASRPSPLVLPTPR